MDQLLPLMQFLSSKPWEKSIQGFVESHCHEFANLEDSRQTTEKVNEYDHNHHQVWSDYCAWVEYILEPMMSEIGINNVDELTELCQKQLKSGRISTLQHKTIQHFVNHYVSSLVSINAFADMMKEESKKCADLVEETLDNVVEGDNYEGWEEHDTGEQTHLDQEPRDWQTSNPKNTVAWEDEATESNVYESNNWPSNEYSSTAAEEDGNGAWATPTADHSWMKEWDLKVVLATSLLEAEETGEIQDRDLELLDWARAVSNLQYYVQQGMRTKGDDEDQEVFDTEQAYNQELMDQWVAALSYERQKVDQRITAKLAGDDSEPKTSKFKPTANQYWQEEYGEKEGKQSTDVEQTELDRLIQESENIQRNVSAQHAKVRRSANRESISHTMSEELYLLVRESLKNGETCLDLNKNKGAKRIFAKLPVKKAHVVEDYVDLVVLENRLMEVKQMVQKELAADATSLLVGNQNPPQHQNQGDGADEYSQYEAHYTNGNDNAPPQYDYEVSGVEEDEGNLYDYGTSAQQEYPAYEAPGENSNDNTVSPADENYQYDDYYANNDEHYANNDEYYANNDEYQYYNDNEYNFSEYQYDYDGYENGTTDEYNFDQTNNDTTWQYEQPEAESKTVSKDESKYQDDGNESDATDEEGYFDEKEKANIPNATAAVYY